MAASTFTFDHHLDFTPEAAESLLLSVPAAPGVFALRGPNAPDGTPTEPYLTRTADLRRRLRRLLAPPDAFDESGIPIPSKRLNLRSRIRFLAYTRTGSDFESTLLLYHASVAAFGPEEARRRLRLHAPFFLRLTLSHDHPRLYSTNRLTRKSLSESFGPFPSRAAADRYADAVLDLFLLRRCYEDLHPFPAHPGCIYGDIKRCMQPCKAGNPEACTPAQYAAEAHRVHDFLLTRGQSLLDEVAAQREAASEAMDFELAATLHKHWEKVRSAALLADELIRPVAHLRALILQPAAPYAPPTSPGDSPTNPGAPGPDSGTRVSTSLSPHLDTPPGAPGPDSGTRVPTSLSHPTDAALFLLSSGQLVGPTRLSTLGVRAVREQTAVGSSLFAQPLMLAPVPLDPETDAQSAPQTPESRAQEALNDLENRIHPATTDSLADLCDTLSLFRRWYYRPEKQRSGEVFLPNSDHAWPIRRLLNGAARVVLGPPTTAPPVDRDASREAAKPIKTKIIHPGREGVERVVPVLPRRPRRKPTTPPSA